MPGVYPNDIPAPSSHQSWLSPHRQPPRTEEGAGKLLDRRQRRRGLLSDRRVLRARHWSLQQKAGIDHIPSNDFSLYDQMLDTIAMLGAVPPRFGHSGGDIPLDIYFAMARGRQDAPAMEMTKWFDTNYHYIVPELTAGHEFRALHAARRWTNSRKPNFSASPPVRC